MSKSKETVSVENTVSETTVTEPVVITEKKVKEKATTREVVQPVGPVMYIGPSIANVVQKSTVFKDGIYPEALNNVIKERPYIQRLLVPIDSLSEARKELAIEQSALSVIYNKVKNNT